VRIGAITARLVAPLQSFEVAIDDGPNQGVLRWAAFTACVDYARLEPAMPEKVLGAGHFQHSARCSGSLVAQGMTFSVAGSGQRERSWGARRWDGTRAWRTMTALFGARRSVNVIEVVDHTGLRSVTGFVHDGGEEFAITDVSWIDIEGASPARADITIGVFGGRRFHFSATAHGGSFPIALDAEATAEEQLLRFESDDGLDGYGIAERLVVAHH